MIMCRRCGKEEAMAPPPDTVIHDLCLACESKLAAEKPFDPKYNPFTYPVPPSSERDVKGNI